MRRMRSLVPRVALIAASAGAAKGEEQTDFKVCQSTYALCTTAPCTPVAGTRHGFLRLRSEDRLFRRPEACQDVNRDGEGKQIRSRYYPVKSYAICDNDRPWAWCLDKPCIIDKDDPTRPPVSAPPSRIRALCDRHRRLHRHDLHHRHHLLGDGDAGSAGHRLPQDEQAISSPSTSKC